jgi:hypothetical protein
VLVYATCFVACLELLLGMCGIVVSIIVSGRALLWVVVHSAP